MLVASGWQADIPPGPGIESMVTPIAKNADGSSITGPVMARFADVPAGSTTQPIIRGRVTGTATPASLDTTKATLTRRTAPRTAAACRSRRRLGVRRLHARRRFPGQPDPAKVCLKGGFDPASLYELTYIAKDPPVHGIGFAATRDLVAFLRQGDGGQSARRRRSATPSRRATRSRATTSAASCTWASTRTSAAAACSTA